jgi:hypothetical protein
MHSHTYVVQAFEECEGGIVPLEPKACPSAASARAIAARLAQTHVGVIPEPPPSRAERSGMQPDRSAWAAASVWHGRDDADVRAHER